MGVYALRRQVHIVIDVRKVLRDLTTGKDGETHDLGRWSWIVTTLSLIAGAIWNAVHAGAVDLMSFAQALGVNVAAHGGALWAKAKTEPEQAKEEPK
jgi:hypothetical protein